jgi:hypothetical protein
MPVFGVSGCVGHILRTARAFAPVTPTTKRSAYSIGQQLHFLTLHDKSRARFSNQRPSNARAISSVISAGPVK